MIVVDTSAVVALFLKEPWHEEIAQVVDRADGACLSLVSRFEVLSVLCGRRFRAEPERIADFLGGLNLEHVSLHEEQLAFAEEGLLRFGRGRHPAALNLGDCFAYGLARTLGAPLLFTGDDFARTDIVPAWRPR
ncbi:MAG TPA: type II toxin-antitoxin system VapC family toxin [Beijerinckiaceae bacterium]|nr:type II toxin-antitoxin system VapC family toxin [Beijerinckiaceae bacterium]